MTVVDATVPQPPPRTATATTRPPANADVVFNKVCCWCCKFSQMSNLFNDALVHLKFNYIFLFGRPFVIRVLFLGVAPLLAGWLGAGGAVLLLKSRGDEVCSLVFCGPRKYGGINLTNCHFNVFLFANHKRFSHKFFGAGTQA